MRHVLGAGLPLGDGGAELDVLELVDGELRVAHDQGDARPGRPQRSRYHQPLAQVHTLRLDALAVAHGELHLQILFAFVEEEESALRHYWRILYKRRFLILALTALGVAAGIFVSMMTRPEYAGTVMVQVAREEAKVLNIEGVEQDGGGTRFDAEFYATQYALLKSRSISELVVRDLGLADNYQFLADFDETKVDEFRPMSRARRFAIATKMVKREIYDEAQ